MRTRLLAAAAAASVLSSLAAADAGWEPPAPAWADVVGVAPDDVLNLRSAPSPRATIVRRLPADTVGMDVVRCQSNPAVSRSTWCLVTDAGVTGWVNARFLHIYGDA